MVWKRPFKKPIFNYYGGKFNQLPQIMPLWPPDLSDIRVCVPFGGALNEVRAIQSRAKSIKVVELSESVLNFFTQLKDSPNELILAIDNLPPSSKGVYEYFRAQHVDVRVWDLLGKAQQAARFAYLMWNGFHSSWVGVNARKANTYSGLYHLNRSRRVMNPNRAPNSHELRQFSQHLNLFDVELICGDALDYLDDFLADPNGFCYMDPPYPSSRHYPGVRNQDISWFEELFGKLVDVKAEWLMTIDLKPEIEPFMREEWYIRPLIKKYSVSCSFIGQRLELSGEKFISNRPFRTSGQRKLFLTRRTQTTFPSQRSPQKYIS